MKTHDRELRRSTTEPIQLQKTETLFRRLFRPLSLVLRSRHSPTRRNRPLENLAPYIRLRELTTAIEPLLIREKAVLTALLPSTILLDFLKYPLPEKAVQELTGMWSPIGRYRIAIRLGVVPEGQPNAGCDRIVFFE